MRRCCLTYLMMVTALAILPGAALGDAISVGFQGINAEGLRAPDNSVLTGAGVNIGQVEPGRVAIRGYDTDGSSNGFVIPVESRRRNGQSSSPNSNLSGGHPLEVASVMIGRSGAPTSVAPDSHLYSSAHDASGGPSGYADVLMTTQYIAKKYQFSDSRHIRVINHSYGNSAPELGASDGNSLLTLGMDWIASEFDVLNVFAGNQNGDLMRVPSDNYNGITVARSVMVDGVFQQVDAGNDNEGDDDAAGDRVSVDLLAPGVDITVAGPGTNNPTLVRTGTSYAAPHVTGAVALLNQYADYQIDNANSVRWDLDNPRKHEVMKAVLLNSADKLAGRNGSMRDVVDENGNNWTSSEAFSDDTISLDDQMGAGHLNAKRALRQFRSGEFNNGETIPRIGWDYGEMGGAFSVPRVYPFTKLDNSYMAVTLAWDRGVTKFGGLDDHYDPSNMFSGSFPDDLDVFICPPGWDDPYEDAYAKSISSDDNVEHIFTGSVPAGNWEIVVNQTQGGERDYGLAWWIGEAIPGDFDDDGDVDGDDLDYWKMDFGMSDESDADGDGDSDGNDFLVWQRYVGTGVNAVAAQEPVPEPAAWMLAAMALPWLLHRRAAA